MQQHGCIFFAASRANGRNTRCSPTLQAASQVRAVRFTPEFHQAARSPDRAMPSNRKRTKKFGRGRFSSPSKVITDNEPQRGRGVVGSQKKKDLGRLTWLRDSTVSIQVLHSASFTSLLSAVSVFGAPSWKQPHVVKALELG